jgi:hypothetical protein
MSIRVAKEPHPELPYERCCFCRAPTPFWTDFGDPRDAVACCEACARRAYVRDVPSKAQWCRRESITDHTYGARHLEPPKPEEAA